MYKHIFKCANSDLHNGRSPPRFMVGCGRCDDWFHGDCVGLDLTKVREMEEQDQMYVCLKCCEEESNKQEPESSSATKPDKIEAQDHKLPSQPRPGPSQAHSSGGDRTVRKVGIVVIPYTFIFMHLYLVVIPPLIFSDSTVQVFVFFFCIFLHIQNSLQIYMFSELFSHNRTLTEDCLQM